VEGERLEDALQNRSLCCGAALEAVLEHVAQRSVGEGCPDGIDDEDGTQAAQNASSDLEHADGSLSTGPWQRLAQFLLCAGNVHGTSIGCHG
jgi:hypothetical protein